MQNRQPVKMQKGQGEKVQNLKCQLRDGYDGKPMSEI